MGLATVVRLPSSWTPLGDHALTWMWTDAVGGSTTPLVGPDARFGWNHLGPWVFYVLAVPYRLLGSSPLGLLVGAALVNIVATLVAVRIARRVGGDGVAAFVGVLAIVFLCTAAGDRLIDPWNPYVVQLPFLLAVIATWAALVGDAGGLAWVVGGASLAAQSHIAYAPPGVLLVAIAAGAAIRHHGLRDRHLRRAAVVAVVAWLPPLVDLVLPHRHNLFKVARWMTRPASSPTVGWRLGADAVLRETGLGATWLGGHLPLRPLSDAWTGGLGLLPGAGLAVLATAGLVAWRRRSRRTGCLVALVAVLLAVGVVELACGRGEMYPYLFSWITVVGVLPWVAGALAAVDLVPRIAPRAGTAMTCAELLAAVVLLAAGLVQGAPRTPRERSGDAGTVRALVAQAEHGLDRATTYELVHGADAASSIYELGIAAQLRDDGYRVVVEPNAVVLFGRHMIDADLAGAPHLSVVEPFESPAADTTVLAVSDPLTAAERAREASLVAALVAAYQAAGSTLAASIVHDADGEMVLIAGWVHPDPQLDPLLHELAALRARGRSVAVELAPPGPVH